MRDLHAAAAFWSYSHEDDALDGGNIVQLARRLSDEFALVTGRELTVFIDREAIGWGDEWRRRIDEALATTTFFIPVVTPRYLMREECRRELLTFIGQAESLGLRDLVLPLLYTSVPNLSEDNTDEVVALVARTQYVDWSSLRLTSPDSEPHRLAVNQLAERLAKVSLEVEAFQRERETASADLDEDAEPRGLAELMQAIHALLPDWLGIVLDEKVRNAQHEGTSQTYNERLAKLRSGGAKASARFAVITNYGKDELPLMRQREAHAQIYLTKTVELDAPIHAALRGVEQYPEAFSLLDDLGLAINEAMESIERPPTGRRSMAEAADEYSHISSLWREIARLEEKSSKLVGEANDLVQVWSRRLEEITQTVAS